MGKGRGIIGEKIQGIRNIVGRQKINRGRLRIVSKDYIFLEMRPFHLGFQISWHTILHSNFLQSVVFL